MKLAPAFTSFVLLSSLAQANQTDYPQFRGPDGQGISTAQNVPTKWGVDQGVAWKKELPGLGWSSPVISEGKVVMTYSQEAGNKVTLGAVALDQKSGDLVWKKELFEPADKEAKACHGKNGLASGTPYLKDGVAYIHFSHMGTAALKLADGDVIWKQKIEYPPMHGTGSSPVVVGDKLVFHADGASNPTLVALDLKSGDIAWRVKRNQKVKKTFSFSTPLELKQGDRSLIISPASGMVGAYDPKDGRLVWKVRYGEGYSVVPRPVYAHGRLYVATGFNIAHLIAINPDKAKDDATDKNLLWDVKKYVGKTPSFLAGDGVLYVIDDNGNLTCRDGKSGDLKWRKKLIGNFSSSPVLVGDLLYCFTEDGVAYIQKVSPEGAEDVFELDMEVRVFASPAVVEGAIFVRSENHLWKIGK